jgi:phosphoribosylpyrophosphate synthetase
MAEIWKPTQIEYQPEVSLTESWGGQARQLWGDKLGRFTECVSRNSATLFTNIGMSVPGIEEPGQILINHKDGSVLPDLGKLMEINGLSSMPKVVFMVASTLSGEDVNAASELARELKENGAECVIGIFKSVAHERQDHKFIDTKSGQYMNQVTTLKGTVATIARSFDGSMTMQDHSDRVTELLFRAGVPNLPMNVLPLLLNESGYDHITDNDLDNLLLIGPDFGRADEARVAANRFRCPLLSLIKDRDRLNGGRPTMIWPEGSREWIRDSRCTVVCVDDEIRDAGTMGAIAADLGGFTDDLRIIAVKAVMSPAVNARKIIRNGQLVDVAPKNSWMASSAVDKLSLSWIREILITDAVQPLTDLTPIADKIRVVGLNPHLEKLVGYLKQNWIPLGENWMRDPNQTDTPLELNLAVEKHKPA